MREEKNDARMFLKASKALLFFVALMLCSCGDVLFHEFRSVDGRCWNRCDTLSFCYNGSFAADEGAGCILFVETRTDASYKYKNLVVCVEVSGKVKTENGELKTEREGSAKSEQETVIFADTLVCEVFDSNGNPNGATAGILYQVSSEPLYIDAIGSDTLLIRVSHLMEAEELSGVYDVGLRIDSSSGRGQHRP